MIRHHRHRGSYIVTSWWGKTIQCMFASGMMTVCVGWMWFYWPFVLKFPDWFAIIWGAIASLLLSTMTVLMGILIYCTVKEKPF